MNNLLTKQTKKEKFEQINLNWFDNPSIQKLLDVVVSIIVVDYIQIAKQNPDIFLNNVPHLSELRGCTLSKQGANK